MCVCVCVCLVLGEDGKGPVSSIDHLSRVIQSIDKISVGALATKRGFCVAGRGKFFDLPALRLARGIPHIWPDLVDSRMGEIKRVCQYDLPNNERLYKLHKTNAL